MAPKCSYLVASWHFFNLFQMVSKRSGQVSNTRWTNSSPLKACTSTLSPASQLDELHRPSVPTAQRLSWRCSISVGRGCSSTKIFPVQTTEWSPALRLEVHSDGEMRLLFDNEMQAVAEILVVKLIGRSHP